MDILEIPLRLRKAKLILYILTVLLIALVVWVTLPSFLEGGFTWKMALGALIFIVGFGFVIKSLMESLTMKNPRLVAAVKDGLAVFYIRHAKGISNQSAEILLSNFERFYCVRSRSHIMITDISFEFVPKAGYLRKEIDPFPELFCIEKHDVNKVLQFIANASPGISIGYDGGVLSQVFRR